MADDLSAAGSSRDRSICGGGLYIEAGNWDAFPNVLNCRFWRNAAHTFGGGVMVNGESDAGVVPRFSNCRFDENLSLGNGGGLARFGGSWAERGVDFERCAFADNRAQLGADLYFSDTQGPNRVSLKGCSFERNRASLKGGGTYFQTGKSGKSGLYIQNCDFKANYAKEGAAIDIFTNGNDFDGEAIIDSCLFLKNASSIGGITSSIIYADQFGTPQTLVKLSNSRLEGNNSASHIAFFSWLYSKVELERNLFYQDTSNKILGVSIVSSVEISSSIFSSNQTIVLGIIDFQGSVRYFNCVNCLFEKIEYLNNCRILIFQLLTPFFLPIVLLLKIIFLTF